MTPIEALPEQIRETYETHEWRHASAVLREDFPEQWRQMIEVLSAYELKRSHIEASGGGRSQISALLDRGFHERGWRRKR